MNPEQKYCAIVVQCLKEEGWEVCQEVETRAGRTDIVAVRGRIRWAIEVKTSMNLAVMDQARANAPYFHYSSLAVPAPAGGKYPRSWRFAEECGSVFGFGVIMLHEQPRWGTVSMETRSRGRLNRRPLPVKLWEEQKTEVEAGSNSGGQYTNFKHTVRQLEWAVRRTPGIKLKDAVANISHHYSNEPSATGSLSRYIRSGIIKTVRIDNGKLFLVEA